MDSGAHDPDDALDGSPRDHADRVSQLRSAALRLDTQPGLLAAARSLRRRLPGDEKFGDTLSTAGAAPVHVASVSRG